MKWLEAHDSKAIGSQITMKLVTGTALSLYWACFFCYWESDQEDKFITSKVAAVYLRIYYCLSKKISLCLNCYQDFLVHEHVIEIENPDNAIQVIRKIDSWISLIKDHGVQYKIESIYNDYFIEIKNYEEKLYSIKEKLKHPINRDIFLWNT